MIMKDAATEISRSRSHRLRLLFPAGVGSGTGASGGGVSGFNSGSGPLVVSFIVQVSLSSLYRSFGLLLQRDGRSPAPVSTSPARRLNSLRREARSALP